MKKIRLIISILYLIILFLAEHMLNQTIDNYNIELKNNETLKETSKELEYVEEEYEEIKAEIQSTFQKTDIEALKENTKLEEENNNSLEGKIISLEQRKKELEEENNNLKNQYIILKNKKETQNQENKFQITNISKYNQYPNYPTGCESVALYILLKYYNIDVTVDDIINNLDKGPTPYTENNILYGANPELEFVGNPKSKSGYGTYEIAIAKVAGKYKSGIINSTGTSLDDLLKIVKQNKPVLVWTSMYLALPYISKTWIYKPTGKTISWKANEHAVVLIGYTNSTVIISDPIDGTIKYQDKNTFENRFNYYGKRSLHY